MIKKILLLLLLSILLTGCTDQNFGINKEISKHLKLKCDKNKILFNEEIDWIVNVFDEQGNPTMERVNKGKIIKYDYISNIEVPIDNGEDISKRTGNAKFFRLKTKNEKQLFEGIFYFGTPFIKQNDKWYQTETATTSIEAFKEQIKISWLDKLLEKDVFAASGDPIYSGAGDGGITAGPAVWATVHDAAAGNYLYNDAEGHITYVDNNIYLFRGFLPFDTSALPINANITAATVNLNVISSVDSDNDGLDYVAIVETFQADHTTLVVGDFEDCGYDSGNEIGGRAKYEPTVEGSDQIDLTAIGTGYKVWTLNATGRGWIKRSGEASTCGDGVTGWTCLGGREGHDLTDDPFTASGDNTNNLKIYFSEQIGTDSDPYLSVTYTILEEELIRPSIIIFD